MSDFHVRDRASILPPEPPGEDPDKPGWLKRVFTSVLDVARRDPEPRAIDKAARGLEEGGAIVFADLDGWPRPPAINGHVPDVYAVRESREIVLEFENPESVRCPPAERQNDAFESWADESPGREYEQIVVRGGRGGRK
jgi:hypothetical protein